MLLAQLGIDNAYAKHMEEICEISAEAKLQEEQSSFKQAIAELNGFISIQVKVKEPSPDEPLVVELKRDP